MEEIQQDIPLSVQSFPHTGRNGLRAEKRRARLLGGPVWDGRLFFWYLWKGISIMLLERLFRKPSHKASLDETEKNIQKELEKHWKRLP